MSPARRRIAVSHVRSNLGDSERRVCRALGMPRSAVRYTPQPRDDEAALTRSMVGLAAPYGRYGYRRVPALLQAQGWQVSQGRVMRLWRREGLKVPAKQPKRGRLWLNDGSCIRLRPRDQKHVGSWDVVFIRTDDGRAVKRRVVMDAFTRACLAIYGARRSRARDALAVFADLMQRHGVPRYIR